MTSPFGTLDMLFPLQLKKTVFLCMVLWMLPTSDFLVITCFTDPHLPSIPSFLLITISFWYHYYKIIISHYYLNPISYPNRKIFPYMIHPIQHLIHLKKVEIPTWNLSNYNFNSSIISQIVLFIANCNDLVLVMAINSKQPGLVPSIIDDRFLLDLIRNWIKRNHKKYVVWMQMSL